MTTNNMMVVISPIMSKERFSVLTGLTEDVIRNWIRNGYIPTVKVGKRRMINVAKLTQEMMEIEH